MKSIIRLSLLLILCVAILPGCASKKRKKNKKVGVVGKFYHNTTAYYNGYFNANELMEESYMALRQAHEDNYNEILPVYDYVSINDPKIVYANLDKAIEKVTRVSSLHQPSNWVDDCYVLMGEAQYLKQEYETAEETFNYFKEEFNPNNPFGRNYQKKTKSKKALKKEREKERKAEQKAREKEKKEAKEAREREKEERKKEKEEAEKQRKREREAAKRERERAKKDKKKRKKRGGKRGSKKRPEKNEEATENTNKTTTSTETKVVEEKTVPDTEKEEIEKEDPRAKDEEDIKKPKKKKPKRDKTAYSVGMMWYAKTLVQRDKLSNASYLVKKLKSDGTLSKDALREVPVILADINIKEENYRIAADYLDEAIDLANNKSLKGRYAFIKGQLFQELSSYSEAQKSFSDAKKWSKSFKMKFMAELNSEKNKLLSGEKDNDAVIAKLNKMLREDKYLEYKDQIYFTQGEILLAQNKFDEALTAFSNSIKNNNSNVSLKQETYYKLAYLFYDKEEYVYAKNYFDSTLMVLDKEDPRFRDCSKYADNLTDIANNIEIINEQDSLLSMTDWSDERIEKLAEKMVAENAAKEEKGGATKEKKRSSALVDGRAGSLKTSDFFAYNPLDKIRGQKSFETIWGKIALEDDWRRKDKSSVLSEGTFEESEEIDLTETNDEEINSMIATIKGSIPYSDDAQLAANKKLEKAFFELGKAYRDKIQNYARATETLETLLDRFPDFDQKLDAYYYLYLSYLELGNSTKANYYKNKIIDEYPDTDYAKAINDPDFAANQLSEQGRLYKYYEVTYNSFVDGDYKEALNKSSNADDAFGKDNPLRPKFALIKAMSTGSVKGKEEYIKALRDVTTRFPNTEEQARADEILRFLKGDKDAFTGVDMKEVDDIFKVDDEKMHYVAVVMYNITPDVLVNAKVSVSNYNKKYHKLKKLQLSEAQLDRKNNHEVILIRRFENKAKAMDYYNEVIKSKDEFISNELGAYEVYPISQQNYRRMIIENSDTRYRAFFNKYYLEK